MIQNDGSAAHSTPIGDAPILRGIRVIEVGQVLAAPFAGAIFADLGAEVIKVERVDTGDDARLMGPAFRHGDSLNFHIFNRGKKSVTVDLKSAQGVAALDGLAAQSDVLLHNLRPGAAEALRIDGATMCERHPHLVYCEISAFGHTGPMTLRPGYEPLLQAYSGLSSSNGAPDSPPIRVGPSICDLGSGMWAVIGALALLQRRTVTGRGGIVNASLLETALVWNAQRGDSFVNMGTMPERHASGHPGFVPYEAFDALDGPFLICCGNDRLFSKLADEIGRPDLAVDERYATNRSRIVNKETLLPELRAILRIVQRDEWIARFLAAGVPCAPILEVPEVLEEPQVKSLGLYQRVKGEDFLLTGLPLSFDGRRPAFNSGAPRLGQHNDELGIGTCPPAAGEAHR